MPPAYQQPQPWTPDPTWFLTEADLQTVRDLVGDDATEWPDASLQETAFLPAALAEAARRVPLDWSTLGDADLQHLRRAVVHWTAGLVEPLANQGRAERRTQGRLTVTTTQTKLVMTQAELLGWANYYFAQIVLPPQNGPGSPPTEAVPAVDSFPRTLTRRASVVGAGPGRLY